MQERAVRRRTGLTCAWVATVAVTAVLLSGCSSLSEVKVRASDYASRQAPPVATPPRLPATLKALVPVAALPAYETMEPVASAPRSVSRLLLSFRTGTAGEPVHVRVECEPTSAGFLRCVHVQRRFGPVRDQVVHALYAWGGLLPLATLNAEAKAPLAVTSYVREAAVRRGRPVSEGLGTPLFDAVMTWSNNGREERVRRVCYLRPEGRARVPAQLASLGRVQHLECRSDALSAAGETKLTLFQGREFTGPVFYLADHGIALPVWFFYSSDQMREAGFYWDPVVWMNTLDGPRRNLRIEVERAGTPPPAGSDG